jgi:hypothetical protein
MKRLIKSLALVIAIGGGLYAWQRDDNHDRAPPPARAAATSNPAVASAPAPEAAWGRDELRAPPRIAEPPVRPELPSFVVRIATQRELPSPALETPAPTLRPN